MTYGQTDGHLLLWSSFATKNYMLQNLKVSFPYWYLRRPLKVWIIKLYFIITKINWRKKGLKGPKNLSSLKSLKINFRLKTRQCAMKLSELVEIIGSKPVKNIQIDTQATKISEKAERYVVCEWVTPKLERNWDSYNYRTMY